MTLYVENHKYSAKKNTPKMLHFWSLTMNDLKKK